VKNRLRMMLLAVRTASGPPSRWLEQAVTRGMAADWNSQVFGATLRRCPDTRRQCSGSDNGIATGGRNWRTHPAVTAGDQTKGPHKIPRPGGRTRRASKLTQHGALCDASTGCQGMVRWLASRACFRTPGLHEAVRARGIQRISGAGPRPRNLASCLAVCSKSMA
jgi:hypothetical protein